MDTYTSERHLDLFGGLPGRDEATVDPREVADLARDEYPARCPRCRGTGGGQYNDCPTCDGNGVV